MVPGWAAPQFALRIKTSFPTPVEIRDEKPPLRTKAVIHTKAVTAIGSILEDRFKWRLAHKSFRNKYAPFSGEAEFLKIAWR